MDGFHDYNRLPMGNRGTEKVYTVRLHRGQLTVPSGWLLRPRPRQRWPQWWQRQCTMFTRLPYTARALHFTYRPQFSW